MESQRARIGPFRHPIDPSKEPYRSARMSFKEPLKCIYYWGTEPLKEPCNGGPPLCHGAPFSSSVGGTPFCAERRRSAKPGEPNTPLKGSYKGSFLYGIYRIWGLGDSNTP